MAIPERPVVIELRSGKPMGSVPQKAIQWFVWALFAVVALGVLAILRFGLPDWTFKVVAWGAPVVAVVVLMTMALRRRGRPSLKVVISDRRVHVRYGEQARPGVERDQVGTVKVGSRWLTMRDPNGKRVLYVPLRPKRDEVLNELRRHGWPVTEGFGGLRRH